MRVDLFDFHLPPGLIAQHPVRPRDAARLLVVRDAALEDHHVRALPVLLRPGDLLVFNDTRVIPARLAGRRGDARIEVTLHQPVRGAGNVDEARWRAFARPARRCRVGDLLSFGAELDALVLAKGEGGEITLGFGCAPEVLLERLEASGRMPLPP
ncbi:MAG TPA: S-adenosylmethionine:tRNA ribosyltransferase-isomerase, partial [Geminicoccaceae bacterium]